MSITISLIAAIAENGVIGRDNAMPWHLSTDLQRFKRITLGKPVIMGRKTWDSIGRPLPGRANIVISRQQDFNPQGGQAVASLSQALEAGRQTAKTQGLDEIFVIGGGEIFRQALPFAQRLYITEILESIEGDALFPQFDIHQWQAISSEIVPKGEKDSHPTRFVIYERL